VIAGLALWLLSELACRNAGKLAGLGSAVYIPFLTKVKLLGDKIERPVILAIPNQKLGILNQSFPFSIKTQCAISPLRKTV